MFECGVFPAAAPFEEVRERMRVLWGRSGVVRRVYEFLAEAIPKQLSSTA